jgi:hypothetical protein
MHCASEIGEGRGLLVETADQVRAIERLALPDGNGNQRQLAAVGHIRIPTDPCRLDLAGDEEPRDLLVRAARNEMHRPAHRLLEVASELFEHDEVRGEQDRRKSKAERSFRTNGSNTGGGRRNAADARQQTAAAYHVLPRHGRLLPVAIKHLS